MPDFVPCRTGEDQDLHLYPSEDAGTALCGKPAGSPVPHPGNRPACPQCGRRLLSRIVALAGDGGVSSVSVTVRPAS